MRRLRHPVISVGSLSAGGAGKTPVVMMLAELLARRGFEVRILTRGYGRRTEIVQHVDAGGDAGEFGDEPLMMARRMPEVAVWVGGDRHRAGRKSERGDTPGAKIVYLLDDGFQHRKLARDIDLLLVTRQDFDDRLLPSGNLREPLSAIARADAVLLREDEREVAELLKPWLRRKTVPVWTLRRQLRFPTAGPLPDRPLVFCGLARPEGFLAMLAANGVTAGAASTFRDHHAYTSRDIEHLLSAARSANADGFMTSEKDAVKLSPAMLDRLQTIGPVSVFALEVEFVEEQATEELLQMLEPSPA